jgi:ABC-2 type transport system ATP-binding protein
MTDRRWALEIDGLCKTFDKPAVDRLSLRIAEGELYALLGPNGAGKTTTLKMVTGLLTPDRGLIRVAGVDAVAHPVEAKQVMAWLPDEPLIYEKLTPLEYLEFVAGLWGLDATIAEARAHELLALLDLDAQANARCQGLSKGMRQKVALAGALIHEPRLIILDEPLTGLDAGSARQVKAVLREHVARGVTIIMTTHILDVAERVADRIGIISEGRLISEGTLDDLRARACDAGFGLAAASLEDIFLDLVGGGAEAA